PALEQVSANRYVTMVIYQKLLPRTKKRGVFYLNLKISSLNRLVSYDEYPPGVTHTHTHTHTSGVTHTHTHHTHTEQVLPKRRTSGLIHRFYSVKKKSHFYTDSTVCVSVRLCVGACMCTHLCLLCLGKL